MVISGGVSGSAEVFDQELRSNHHTNLGAKGHEGSASHHNYHEDDDNPLAALEGQLAALLNQGFFSPITTLGSDPDGAGGALTLGPASAASAALMFKLESNPNLTSV